MVSTQDGELNRRLKMAKLKISLMPTTHGHCPPAGMSHTPFSWTHPTTFSKYSLATDPPGRYRTNRKPQRKLSKSRFVATDADPLYPDFALEAEIPRSEDTGDPDFAETRPLYVKLVTRQFRPSHPDWQAASINVRTYSAESGAKVAGTRETRIWETRSYQT